MVFKRWATRKLRSGDLTALNEIAVRGEKPRDVCIQRLSDAALLRCGPAARSR